MNKKQLFKTIAASLTFLILAGLPTFTRYHLGHFNLTGVLSDVLVAILLFYPVISFSRLPRTPFLILWAFINAGSFALFQSMLRMPSWADLLYLGDGGFLKNTFSGFSLSEQFPLLLFGSGFIFLMLPSRSDVFKPIKPFKRLLAFSLSFTMILSIHTALFSSNQNLYTQYNPLHWLFVHPLITPVKSKNENFQDVLTQDLKGARFINKGKAKNVLIVVMEGMTGSYIAPARDFFDLPQPQTEMPLLSAWSKKGMVLPDFIAHSHQTIRGLYAMLCADVSKLSWSTPKATQLQNAPEKAAFCLPNQLKTRGYSTHYLQASGLTFMGKDKFMPFIGFEQVQGLEWFNADPNSSYRWGVDDETFFKGALSYIDTIRVGKKPWMLTLLTVGTHQPYEVTDEFAANYWDRKQAAVAFLDLQVSHFLADLEKKGVLKDTLVIVTADESHGSELGDWASAWIPFMVFAPEQKKLPKFNTGHFGLLDVTLSVLDYLQTKPLPAIPGRSVFRNYTTPRQLVSFTADRLRWLDDNGKRLECTSLGKCQTCNSQSIIGPATCKEDKNIDSQYWIKKSEWLDQNLSRLSHEETFQFASGKKQIVKHAWKDQWADNLSGALYLDFPEKSKTQVHIQWKVIKAPPEGLALTLLLKEAERDVNETTPELPLLHEGEESGVDFEIENKKARNGFSFHLLAEEAGTVEITDFTVEVKKEGL